MQETAKKKHEEEETDDEVSTQDDEEEEESKTAEDEDNISNPPSVEKQQETLQWRQGLTVALQDDEEWTKAASKRNLWSKPALNEQAQRKQGRAMKVLVDEKLKFRAQKIFRAELAVFFSVV